MKDDFVKTFFKDFCKRIGDNPNREGLKDTPRRLERSWEKLYGGYTMDPAIILKTKFSGMKSNEMVVLRNIEFYSTCEHHLLPFFGKAHIGYIPQAGKVVGISKLARLLEVFARRLQIQERLSAEIADAIMKYVNAAGAGALIEAQHLCMTSRGVEKQNSVMVTSALRGEFMKSEVRNEFLEIIKR